MYTPLISSCAIHVPLLVYILSQLCKEIEANMDIPKKTSGS